ncbi:permease family protein [Rhodococcus sp. MTM3W5.2]|nr:permease family protein [Rhodococcus sp. MTM3W5.2]
MSLAAAMMLGVETQRGLELVGMTTMSGMLSAIANTRELAPVVVAIALAAKVGTGFTAQIGAMRISDEIDALDAMAIRSIPFLAGTRVLAAMVCVLPIFMVGLLASYLSTRLVIVFWAVPRRVPTTTSSTWRCPRRTSSTPLSRRWSSPRWSRWCTAHTAITPRAAPRGSGRPRAARCAPRSSRSGSSMC